MKPVLQQKQELNLIMSLKLRQAIELLQYSTYELYQYIKEQELENPLIVLEEPKNDGLFEVKTSSKAKSINSSKLSLEVLTSRDIDMRNKLFEQAMLLFNDARDQQLLGYIIHNLDDNGYLFFCENELVAYGEFEETEIDRGIQLLQQVGPIGIGARSVKECLLLQITNNFPEQKLAECLIQNHLDLLANKRWDVIASRMKLSLGQVKEIYDFIQTLDPKPCSLISDFSIEYVNPDIVVEIKESDISFYLNDRYLPRIHFNNEYSSLINSKDETSKYIKNQYSSYQWLLNSIEQRRQTILKIVKVMLNKQENFFREVYHSMSDRLCYTSFNRYIKNNITQNP